MCTQGHLSIKGVRLYARTHTNTLPCNSANILCKHLRPSLCLSFCFPACMSACLPASLLTFLSLDPKHIILFCISYIKHIGLGLHHIDTTGRLRLRYCSMCGCVLKFYLLQTYISHGISDVLPCNARARAQPRRGSRAASRALRAASLRPLPLPHGNAGRGPY